MSGLNDQHIGRADFEKLTSIVEQGNTVFLWTEAETGDPVHTHGYLELVEQMRCSTGGVTLEIEPLNVGPIFVRWQEQERLEHIYKRLHVVVQEYPRPYQFQVRQDIGARCIVARYGNVYNAFYIYCQYDLAGLARSAWRLGTRRQYASEEEVCFWQAECDRMRHLLRKRDE